MRTVIDSVSLLTAAEITACQAEVDRMTAQGASRLDLGRLPASALTRWQKFCQMAGFATTAPDLALVQPFKGPDGATMPALRLVRVDVT